MENDTGKMLFMVCVCELVYVSAVSQFIRMNVSTLIAAHNSVVL